MRDLIERHDAFGREMMADLTAMPAAATAEPAGGQNGFGRCTVHSGGREQPQRVSDATGDAMRAGLRSYIVMDRAAADAVMLAARSYVEAVWDQSLVLAAEDGSAPLVATEPWEEHDDSYRKRLARAGSADAVDAPAEILDRIGLKIDVFRARLVPVEPCP